MLSIHKLSEDSIWQKASQFLVELLRTNQNKKVLLLLSGGSAVKLYKRITKYELRSKNLAIAQVDERFQPGNEGDINAFQIEKTGLFEVCREKNIPYYLIPQEGTLKEAANDYNRIIADLFEHFSYKIGVLGIGEDAHSAGLLPGYEDVWNINNFVVGYEVNNRRQNNPAVLFSQKSIKDGVRKRITITPKALQQIDHAIVVAAGEGKREALEKIKDMKIKDMDKCPAVILRKLKNVDLFTDI